MSRIMSSTSLWLVAFAWLFTVVHALPFLKLDSRDVVDPPITFPTAGVVLSTGSKLTVTWDTSELPPRVNVTNPRGKIVLGFLENDSENLMLDSPLAQGFDIFLGSFEVTVPDVSPRNDYIICLMGSSGNISPEFSIVANPPASSTYPATNFPAPSPTVQPISSAITPPGPKPTVSPTPSSSGSDGNASGPVNQDSAPPATPPSKPAASSLSSPAVPTVTPLNSTTNGNNNGAAQDGGALASHGGKVFSSIAVALAVTFFMV